MEIDRLSFLVGLLLVVLCSGNEAWGEDNPKAPMASEAAGTLDYPVVDTRSLTFTVNMPAILPWVERYHSFDGDFAKQNELAFRLSRRRYGWLYRMAFVMSDPRTSARTKQAVTHFASASYTNVDNWREWNRSLSGREPEIIVGVLRMLRAARPLKADGADTSWPGEGLLDPQRMPERIVRVLKENPKLALDVILTLEAYGPLARKEVDVLPSLLLSSDPQAAIASQAAILKMDPQGLGKLFHLEGMPLTEEQVGVIRRYARSSADDWPVPWMPQPAYDLRESDGSPLNEQSRLRHELYRFMRFKSDRSIIDPLKYHEERELAIYFSDQKSPGDWWTLLSIVNAEEMGFYFPDDYQLHQMASALYTKPGARDEMLRVLHSDDPHVAQAMANLLCDMRLYKPGIIEYEQGDLVDPEVIPAELVKVGQRHPHLKVEMAAKLGVYQSHAAACASAIVPLLLKEDTYDVQRIRRCITQVDPKLAEKLEISYVHLRSVESGFFNEDAARSEHETEAVDGPPR